MIGLLLHERYRIESELGRGGMGVIYRAHDTLLDRQVAIKVMSDSGLSQDGRTRLLHEARAAAGLSHANIVTVFDVVEDDDSLYIVMELVPGKSLKEQHIEELDSILDISQQLCSALDHAHQNGIIHRDLKPENVLIVDRKVMLMDFGLARSMSSRLSIEGDLVGTAYYLAPEQALGLEVDARTDLYSLGVMMYELVTGRLPFTAQDTLAVISQHLHAPIVPPRTYNENIDRNLNELILRLMAKTPEERPETANEVLMVIKQIRSADQPAETGEEIDLLQQIVQGRLVGRQTELEVLRRHWLEAQQGHAQMVLLSGEPGVGKTRLASELTAYARLHGAAVFQGGCYEYEAKVPYLPFVEALRDWVHDQSTEGLQEQLGDSATELAKLAPEIDTRLGPLAPNPSLDPDQERLRMYDHFARFLQNLSTAKGLLFFIDDLHWADQGTLSLVHYLLRRLRNERVLILGGYREVELDRTHPLAASLVEWNRERLTTRIQLGRLTKEDCGELLAAMFEQDEITDEFNEAIYRETEGNPFFIEEVVKALVDQGQIYRENLEWQRGDIDDLAIPQSIKEAIGRRLDRLNPQSIEALQYAAILGKTFEFNELLTIYSNGDQSNREQEDLLLDALDEALNAQLLRALEGETFGFTHDKIRETLYEELNAIRRRRLHLKSAQGLENLHGETSQQLKYPELAYHYLQGGDLQKGMEYAIMAGEQARGVYAYNEALQYYLEAAEGAESLELSDEMVEIYRIIGDLYFSQGLFDNAVDFFHRSLALATNIEQQARLKMLIGMVYAQVGDVRGLQYLQNAKEELNPETQTVDLVNTMVWIGRYYHYQAKHQKAIESFENALEAAKPLNQLNTLISLYGFLSGSYQHILEMDQSAHWARECISLGEREDIPLAVAIGNEFLAENAAMGQWEKGIQYADRDQEIGERIGAQDRVAWSKFSRSSILHGLGRLNDALEDAQSGLEDAERIGEHRLAIWLRSLLASIQIDLDLDEEAELNIKHGITEADEIDQVVLQCWSRYAYLQLLLKRSDWHTAVDVSKKAKALYRTTENLLGRVYIGTLTPLAYLGAGRVEEAQEVLEEQLQLVNEKKIYHFHGVTLRVQGQVLAALGDKDASALAYQESIRLLEGLGSKLELGRAHYHLARLRRIQDQSDAAQEEADRALQLFTECGAKYDLANTHQLIESI